MPLAGFLQRPKTWRKKKTWRKNKTWPGSTYLSAADLLHYIPISGPRIFELLSREVTLKSLAAH